jgi:hypothetical protein
MTVLLVIGSVLLLLMIERIYWCCTKGEATAAPRNADEHTPT